MGWQSSDWNRRSHVVSNLAKWTTIALLYSTFLLKQPHWINVCSSTLLVCTYFYAETNYKQPNSTCFSRKTAIIYNMDYACMNVYASTLLVHMFVEMFYYALMFL